MTEWGVKDFVESFSSERVALAPRWVAKRVVFHRGANAPRSLILLAYIVSPHKL